MHFDIFVRHTWGWLQLVYSYIYVYTLCCVARGFHIQNLDLSKFVPCIELLKQASLRSGECKAIKNNTNDKEHFSCCN